MDLRAENWMPIYICLRRHEGTIALSKNVSRLGAQVRGPGLDLQYQKQQPNPFPELTLAGSPMPSSSQCNCLY